MCGFASVRLTPQEGGDLDALLLGIGLAVILPVGGLTWLHGLLRLRALGRRLRTRGLRRGAGLLGYRTEGVLRGYLLWSRGAGDAPEIERLYVAPGWRRRGIEERLRRRLPQPS